MRRKGLRLDRADFEAEVAAVLDRIPEPFSDLLSNVIIVIEDAPDAALRAAHGPLLGLYEGIPFTEGDGGGSPVLPSQIRLFQRPHERLCETLGELRAEIRETVLHEIAHQFGLSDAQLDAMGPLRRRRRHP